LKAEDTVEVVVISDLLFRLRALFRRKSVEAELDEELRAHFEHQVDKHVKSGLSFEEARRRTRLEFGGIDQAKEECRDARGVNLMETMVQDLRYAVRILRKSPGFTAVAVISLGLGIGANTAIFQLLDAVRLRSLPVSNPHELVEVRIRGGHQGMGVNNGTDPELTRPIWQEIEKQSLIAGRWAGSLLFGLKPYDPLTLIAAGVLLAATAVVASFLPAHRASKVDPMVALRHE
jgi:hypothetical protein